MTMIADVDTFGIGLPEAWVSLPLPTADFDRFKSDLFTRWRAEPDYDKTTERKAELLLNRVRGELTRHGARFAAAYFDAGLAEGVAAVDGPLLPMMAVCTFAVYSRNDLDTDAKLTLPTLFAAFARRADPDTANGTIDNVEPPMVHQLNAARCVRLRRLCRPHGFGPAAQDPFYAETFIMPLADDGEAAGVLQFATVNIDLATDFSTLFEAIAQTMTLFTPNDPTVLNMPHDLETHNVETRNNP
jgi:hypothetical protein